MHTLTYSLLLVQYNTVQYSTIHSWLYMIITFHNGWNISQHDQMFTKSTHLHLQHYYVHTHIINNNLLLKTFTPTNIIIIIIIILHTCD